MGHKAKGNRPKRGGSRPEKARPRGPAAVAEPAGAAPERKYPRIPSQTSVLIRKLGGSIRGELSTTLVVGKGGCSFTHAQAQGVGSELYLSIQVGADLVEARVRVVYDRPQEGGTFEVGVEFLEVAKRDEPILERLLRGSDPAL